jgi:RNA polymerase sigma-70 factor (ECF subfamily)
MTTTHPRGELDLEALYRKYGPMVLRRCRALLRNEEDALDAMHETFVRLLRAQARLDDHAPSSLLYKTATRVCLNLLRSRHRRREAPADDPDALLQRIAASGDGYARVGAFRLLDRLFRDELESTQTLAVLHPYDGLTLDEVALHSGLSVSGVRKRLSKLRASLRELEAQT